MAPIQLIAELCQNHNGDTQTLFRMVDAAVDAGATHVKIQHIYVSNLTFRPQFEHGLISPSGETLSICRPFKDEYKRLKSLELSSELCIDFVSYCHKKGVIPLTTCFTRGDISTILKQGFRHIKVASYDCSSFPLLQELSRAFDHIYVSTGASFDDEISHAAEILSSSSTPFSLLHCVTNYPTPISSSHLARLSVLKSHTRSVGFSDHSLTTENNLVASMSAIYLGAEIIERHFTILPPSDTKDGPVSVTPSQLKQLSDFTLLTKNQQRDYLDTQYPDWKLTLGDPYRTLQPSELLNRDYYRGRFATPRTPGVHRSSEMIFNFESTPIAS